MSAYINKSRLQKVRQEVRLEEVYLYHVQLDLINIIRN